MTNNQLATRLALLANILGDLSQDIDSKGGHDEPATVQELMTLKNLEGAVEGMEGAVNNA